jgi:hypothetical protein
MGRYLYRVAIANSRLESFEDGRVTFRYRDNRTGEMKRCTLEAEDFIGRFLQHVLPRGFAKVRSWGLFSSKAKDDLQTARSLLAGVPPSISASDVGPHKLEVPATEGSGDHDPPCPKCKLGRLRIVQVLPRGLPSLAARGPPP